MLCDCEYILLLLFELQLFEHKPIITLEYIWVFKHSTFLVYCFQHKCNNTFLVPRALAILYLDAT